MSKRADDNEASSDMEAGMTTAERRRRRRRGAGLRVPSDNVPRRSPTSPPPVAPVPEDPNLAVSIAYSFNSDQSGPHVRPDTTEPGEVNRPDTLTGDGPDVGDGEIMAPEAQATAVDLDAEDGQFELKTREMTAVDLEALGLEDPSGEGKPRTSGPIPTPGPSATIIIDDDAATRIQEPPKRPTSPLAAASSPGIPKAPPPRPPGTTKPPIDPPAPATVAAGTRPKMPTPAPAFGIVERTPLPGRAPSEAEGPDEFEDEKSVEISFDDPSRPGIVKMNMPSEIARPVVTRASTVALSDDDLEELMDGASGRNAKPTNASGETVALSDTDLEDEDSDKHAVPKPAEKLAKATKDESGEIVVDVMEELDSGDVAEPVPPVAPVPQTTLRGLGSASPTPSAAAAPTTPGAPAAASTSGERPVSSPSIPATPPPAQARTVSRPDNPVAPTAQGSNPGGNGAQAKPTPPPTPIGQKSGETKLPPPAPAPAKKPATPAGSTTAAAVAAAVKAPADKRTKRSKPWFEEIFDEDYLRTLPFLTPQATQAEAAFVVDVLNVQTGAQLLDLGCGYGRHAMELAARGFHLVGLDLSLPLLLRGADEAQRRGLSINFVHADMRELDFDAQFDGVYCLFSTFGFFDDETNKKTATAVARALKPGGRLVIEVLNRDYIIGELPTRVWWEGDGCVVLEEVEFNYFSSRIHSNRSVVFDDGRQIEQEISIRAYSLHELGKLLHAAGFRVVEVSGSVHTRGRFFGNHSRHIIVVAEKKPRDAADK